MVIIATKASLVTPLLAGGISPDQHMNGQA